MVYRKNESSALSQNLHRQSSGTFKTQRGTAGGLQKLGAMPERDSESTRTRTGGPARRGGEFRERTILRVKRW